MINNNNMIKIWNTAVNLAGGLHNTISNFENIAKKFIELAKKNGFQKQETFNFIDEQYFDTVQFMNVRC